MEYFEKYVSNTIGAGGNQLYFAAEQPRTCRVFYKITVGGTYDYALLFSNIMDSTYADGSVSHKNLICEPWTIHSASVARCAGLNWRGEAVCEAVSLNEVKHLTFGGKVEKRVAPGEFFTSDAVEMTFEAGEYLCLEMTVSGKKLPYHEESILPIFVKDGDMWLYDKHMPLPGMVGCARKVDKKVGFFGDSITQGIGTEPNAYAHWNAVAASALGEKYAFWNLGIGYGRANDAASDGAWMYKVKHNDWVVVCFGVNDIFQIQDEEQIKKDLMTIVKTLKGYGAKVLVQTVPPFDYEGEKIGIWQRVNDFIFDVIAKEADAVFDAASVLALSENEPHKAKYGGHPDAVGCKAWGEALAPVLEKLLME